MRQPDFSNLCAVTEAAFQREYQHLRPVLQREAQLRRQLALLDQQLAEVRHHTTGSDGYRVTGTDILWQSWESASRRQLNIELARTRAQKLNALEKLRTAFGRKQAVSELSKQALAGKSRAP